jgi:hypothetical protein
MVGFEIMSKQSMPPTVVIEHIRVLRPDLAIVSASWRFPEGILLVDGDRIPAFSQVDTYVAIKSQGRWLIAVHEMQEVKQ